MKLIHLLIFLLLFGCSGNPIKLGADESEKIEGTFDLSDKDLKQFAGTETVQKKAAKKVVVSKKKKTLKKNTKSAPEATVSKEKTSSAVNNALPEDYPEKFVEYDKRSKKYWDMFKPSVRLGEKLRIRVKYAFFTVGDAVIENLGIKKLFGQDVIHSQVRIKSADYYSAIYSLNDVLDSYVSVKTFTPLKYSLIQRESRQDVDDLQLFSQTELKTHYWYRRLKKSTNYEKKTKKEAYIPKYFLDTFSGFFFLRGLPLDKLKVVEFPVVSRAEVDIMQLTYMGVDKIEIMNKEVVAWKVKAEAKLHGKLQKKGDLIFWYAADGDHRLLKFEGKVKIGSVKGELIEYEPGTLQKL